MKNKKTYLLFYTKILMLYLMITFLSGCVNPDKSMLLGGLIGNAIGNSEYKNRFAKESASPVNFLNNGDFKL